MFSLTLKHVLEIPLEKQKVMLNPSAIQAEKKKGQTFDKCY